MKAQNYLLVNQEYEVKVDKVANLLKSLSTRELFLLAQVYCGLDFPHTSIVLKDAMAFLRCSKMTARRVLNDLVSKELLVYVGDFTSFYYPVKDQGNIIRARLFVELGVCKL